MPNEKIGRTNNELAPSTGQNTPEPEKLVVGRVNSEPTPPVIPNTLEPEKKVVGRVNNELDKNTGLETATHVEEIGVVNNEKKPD